MQCRTPRDRGIEGTVTQTTEWQLGSSGRPGLYIERSRRGGEDDTIMEVISEVG